MLITLNKNLLTSVLAALLLLVVPVGCATKKPRQTRPSIPVVGPPAPEDPAPTPQEPPPEGEETRSPRIALVIGGAGVASFATVGLLKRFEQEGVKVDFILASGWPALFALANGFLKSVHDLEWFAMRLKEEELMGKGGLFGADKEFSDHGKLSKLLDQFRQTDLRQSRVPVYLATTSVHDGTTTIYTAGKWKAPLLKTFSVPGIYSPYPAKKSRQWISSTTGLHTEHSLLKKADVVIAVDMYPDYFQYLRRTKIDSSSNLFRRIFQVQFQRRVSERLAKAHIRGKILIKRSPNAFGAKRKAIKAGYDEGTRILSQLRNFRTP